MRDACRIRPWAEDHPADARILGDTLAGCGHARGWHVERTFSPNPYSRRGTGREIYVTLYGEHTWSWIECRHPAHSGPQNCGNQSAAFPEVHLLRLRLGIVTA